MQRNKNICLIVICFPVILIQCFQLILYSKGELLSSSGDQPLDDPPTFIISSLGYKSAEESPQPPLTIEITVGDPPVPGLDLTGFEYELAWFAKGVSTPRSRKVARQLVSDGNDVVEKLPFSLTGSNGYKLGDEIYAQFKVRYYRVDIIDSSDRDFSPWSELETSSSYQTGILVSPTGDIHVKECNQNYSQITLTLNTPINCPNSVESCVLGISMFFERIPGSQFYWSSRQEVVLSACQVSLNNTVLGKDIDVYLKGICDSVEELDDVILLRFEFSQSTYFWNSYSLPDKKVHISNTPSRWCTYQGDPHMKTFDGLSFSYFGIGDYVLYQNKQFKLEINARLWPCVSQASCICGIAIREGNDVLVLKGCNIKKPWQFAVAFKAVSSSSSSPIQVWKGISSYNKYYFRGLSAIPPMHSTEKGVIGLFSIEVFLGNGAQLIITHTYNPEMETSWVNAMLRVPNQGLHQGMCGNYDGITENDLAYGGDGLDYTGDPSKFGESWSLVFNVESWFKKTPTYTDGNRRKMCSCGTRAGWWSDSKPRLATRCGYTEENHFLIIPRTSEDITESLRANARTRRAADDDADSDLFVEESDDDGEFILDDFKKYRPIETLSWPTAGGLTKAQVYDYCRGVIFDSSGANECQNVTAKTSGGNNSDLLEDCVKDIQITDQKFWSSSALSTFQLQCDEAILEEHVRNIANETETIQNDGTQAVSDVLILVPEVVAITCAGDCSGNGSCVQGGCVCNAGRTGVDCSLRTDQIPVLKGIYLDGLCDVRVQSCKAFRVNGFGFANFPGSSLTCHVSGFEVYNATWNESSHQVSTTALLIDLYQVQCNLLPHPVSRDKDPYVAGTPAVGMEISVSNDGETPSNKQIVIVYDGLCLTCTTAGKCSLKNNTCLINGKCYVNGDVHAYEITKFCQPGLNTDQWTEKKDMTSLEGEGKDTTVIIIAGVVAPFFLLIVLGLVLRFCVFGAHNRGAELDHSEDHSDFYFHY